jgi:hypothetical protein
MRNVRHVGRTVEEPTPSPASGNSHSEFKALHQ